MRAVATTAAASCASHMAVAFSLSTAMDRPLEHISCPSVRVSFLYNCLVSVGSILYSVTFSLGHTAWLRSFRVFVWGFLLFIMRFTDKTTLTLTGTFFCYFPPCNSFYHRLYCLGCLCNSVATNMSFSNS